VNPRERTVSRTFRDEIFKIYPKLQHQPYAELFCYLCFGTAKDKDFDRLLIPSSVLASYEDKQNYHRSKNYSARSLLARFQLDTGIELEVSGYYSLENKCRSIKKFNIPNDVADLVEKERRNMWIKQDRVYFVDGRKYNPKIQREYYNLAQLKARELVSEAGCQSTCKIGMYLNELSPNRFSKIMAHWQEAVEFAERMPGSVNKRGKDNTEEVRKHNLNILQAIADQPQPFYQPSKNGKTVRLFSLNQSLLGLSKEVRKILTRDWYEADLRSSQLAIVAQQWNIPYIVDFLKSDVSVWSYLCEELDIEYNPSTKASLKTALYATIFGMKPTYVSYQLNLALKSQNIGKNFILCRLLRELLTARERKIKQILQDSGCYNCYSEWLSLDDFEKESDGVNSILSQCAQAAEMSILSPVVDLAIRDPHFSILLWQHDGFCWVTDDTRRESYYENLLINIVTEKCKLLNIATHLENIKYIS